MKKALAHDGLARGLHESARAIERGQAQVRTHVGIHDAQSAACLAASCLVPCWRAVLLRLVCVPCRCGEVAVAWGCWPTAAEPTLSLPTPITPHSWPSWPTTATSPTTRS